MSILLVFSLLIHISLAIDCIKSDFPKFIGGSMGSTTINAIDAH
jgi:hypothetical protein